MNVDEREDFARRMRVPLFAFVLLMVLLAVNVTLGALMPFPSVWIVQLLVAVSMIVVVMLFSMEILDEPPLMRLYAVLGFCWVAILFGMTLIDYLTR